jgi:hypothetical protein
MTMHEEAVRRICARMGGGVQGGHYMKGAFVVFASKTRGRSTKHIHFSQEALRRQTSWETMAQTLKSDLKKCDVDWIQLAQDRVQWWIFVKMQRIS